MRKYFLLGLFLLSSNAFGAMPCHYDQGNIGFKLPVNNPTALEYNSLSFSGLEGNGSAFDLNFRLELGIGLIRLESAFETSEVNPGNSLNISDSTVDIGCVKLGAENYWFKMGIIQTEPTVDLDVRDFGLTYDFSRNRNWKIDYSGSLPDDTAVVNENGTVSVGGNPGSVEYEGEGKLSFDLGLSNFNIRATYRGGYEGDYDHFNEQGTFTATAISSSSLLELIDGRYEVEIDWSDSEDSGQGQAVPLTEDSGAFYFFEPENWEMLVRVVDSCNINNNFWVFSAATTNVAYTLTVTDTQSNDSRVYTNPLGTMAPAIVDTEAFATCP